MSYLDVFKQIKSLESSFPLPIDYVTINVGTFDAATGIFEGLTTTSETDPEPLEHRPGQRPSNPPPHFSRQSWVEITIDPNWRQTITQVPAPKAPFAPVLLAFQIRNQGSNGWTVSAGGFSNTVAAAQSSGTVNIWDLNSTGWSITCGSKSYKDRIMIQRPPGKIAGAGAFTVPALPLSVVYAPPADAAKLSKANYQVTQSVGVKSSFQFSNDTSTVKDWFGSPLLENLKGFQDVLNGLAKAFSFAQDSNPLSTLGKVFEGIASGIGTISGSETDGNIDIYDNSLTITESKSQTIFAEVTNGGPGAGDSVHYLRDAKFAWVIADGRFRIALLGGIYASLPASYLSAHVNDPAATSLPADVVRQLLSLDPFVSGGPMAALPDGRFEDVDDKVPGPIEYGGGQTLTGSYSQTFEMSETRTHTSYTTQTSDFNPGWLGKLFGAERSGLKITVSSTQAAGTTSSETQTINWELHSGTNERFVVEVWRDRLFGTFAFRQEPVNPTPRLQGIAKAADGSPLKNQAVKLVVNGKTYSAMSDKNGHYAFYARKIPAGTASLQIAHQAPKTVTIAAP